MNTMAIWNVAGDIGPCPAKVCRFEKISLEIIAAVIVKGNITGGHIKVR